MIFGLSGPNLLRKLEQKGITSENVDENVLKAITIAIEENNKVIEKQIADKVAEDFARKSRNMGLRF